MILLQSQHNLSLQKIIKNYYKNSYILILVRYVPKLSNILGSLSTFDNIGLVSCYGNFATTGCSAWYISTLYKLPLTAKTLSLSLFLSH